MTSKKIDALMDTIDNELSDLENIVDAQRPGIEERKAPKERSVTDLGNETLPFEDVDDYWNSEEAAGGGETASKSLDQATGSALDAISDVEDEVKAMLSGAEKAEQSGVSPASEGTADAGDAESDKALQELLSTREVDATAILSKAPAQKKPETDADDDQLLDSLFSEVEITVESDENIGRPEEPIDLEAELPQDLLGDPDITAESIEELSMDSGTAGVGQDQSDDSVAEGQAAVGESIDAGGPELATRVEPLSDTLIEDLNLESEVAAGKDTERDGNDPDTLADENQLDDLFEDPKLEVEVEKSEESDYAESSPQAEPADDLADLISSKVEALVIRLVEERLPGLADRIISERLKVIFDSMDRSVKS